MDGRKLPLSEFKAEQGKVAGTYRFAPPRDYAGWGAGELQAELKLVAVGSELKGQISFWSKRAASRLSTSVTLKSLS